MNNPLKHIVWAGVIIQEDEKPQSSQSQFSLAKKSSTPSLRQGSPKYRLCRKFVRPIFNDRLLSNNEISWSNVWGLFIEEMWLYLFQSSPYRQFDLIQFLHTPLLRHIITIELTNTLEFVITWVKEIRTIFSICSTLKLPSIIPGKVRFCQHSKDFFLNEWYFTAKFVTHVNFGHWLTKKIGTIRKIQRYFVNIHLQNIYINTNP